MDAMPIDRCGSVPAGEEGFTLAEFLMATLILLVLSGAMFSMLSETGRAASYQTEVQAVLDNTRIAMNTVEHIIRQAGNNPTGMSMVPVNIGSAESVTIQSDLTGSVAADKGDPNGTIADSSENVTISYNSTTRSIQVDNGSGTPQAVASYISGLTMQYFDAAGAETTVGNDVRKIAVTITGSSTLPDPQTHEVFSVRLRSDIQIANRQ